DMLLGVLESGGDVTLRSGLALTSSQAATISQRAGAYIATGVGSTGGPGSTGTLTAWSVGGQALTEGNAVGRFTARNTGGGPIVFRNEGDHVRIGAVTQASGHVFITGRLSAASADEAGA